MRTECHSSWIPFWRERRRDGWAGEKRDRGGKKRKSKELETREGGREFKGKHVSVCEYKKRWLNPGGVLKDESGWLLVNDDETGNRRMMTDVVHLVDSVCLMWGVTHISRTVLSCSSLDFFSSISQSLCWPSSTSSRRAISSTSWKHRGSYP